jgi:hypothetical protein
MRRRLWWAEQPFVDADKLVFIDKTGAKTKMTRYTIVARVAGALAQASNIPQLGFVFGRPVRCP